MRTMLIAYLSVLKRKLKLGDAILCSYHQDEGEMQNRQIYTRKSKEIFSYGITRHCHVPEIEQERTISWCQFKITVSFTPTLMPMVLGTIEQFPPNGVLLFYLSAPGYHYRGINLGAKGNTGIQLQIHNKLFVSFSKELLSIVAIANGIIIPLRILKLS